MRTVDLVAETSVDREWRRRVRSSRLRLASLVGAALIGIAGTAVPVAAQDNGSVQGTFWFEDGDSGDRWDVTFRDGVAYTKHDDDMDRDETKIVISDQMVNRDRMMRELTGDGWWSAHGTHIEISLCEWEGETKVCGLNLQLGSSSISTSGGDELAALAKSLEVAGGRVKAHLVTAAPMEFFDDTYGLDVTVDVPLVKIE